MISKTNTEDADGPFDSLNETSHGADDVTLDPRSLSGPNPKTALVSHQ